MLDRNLPTAAIVGGRLIETAVTSSCAQTPQVYLVQVFKSSVSGELTS